MRRSLRGFATRWSLICSLLVPGAVMFLLVGLSFGFGGSGACTYTVTNVAGDCDANVWKVNNSVFCAPCLADGNCGATATLKMERWLTNGKKVTCTLKGNLSKGCGDCTPTSSNPW
jgi:hypothetical protein